MFYSYSRYCNITDFMLQYIVDLVLNKLCYQACLALPLHGVSWETNIS